MLCDVCRENSLISFLDLGNQPNGNQFIEKSTSPYRENRLKFLFCPSCLLVSQENQLSPQELYDHHPYLTSTNKKYLQELLEFKNFALSNHQVEAEGYVLDVGCNDGSLLRMFRSDGYQVLGIDPGEVPFVYSQKVEIPVVKDFFGLGTAKKYFAKKYISLITSTASFYHVSSPHDWLTEAKEIIGDQGAIAIQFVDLRKVIETLAIDQFYHEHTFLFSFTSLHKLAERNGLHINAVDEVEAQGGSIRVILSRTESYSQEDKISGLLQKDAELFDRNFAEDFLRRLEEKKSQLTYILDEIFAKGEEVVGLGASLRGISLLNFLQLPLVGFRALAEVNERKIGSLTAKFLIPVIGEDAIPQHIKYFFVLAWTEKEKIISKFRSRIESGSTLLFPSPKIDVVGDDPLDIRRLLT